MTQTLTTFTGLIFGAQFQLSYLAAIVFAAPPYNYQPIIIGLILLAFGGGNVVGSVLGGRSVFSLVYAVRADGEQVLGPGAAATDEAQQRRARGRGTPVDVLVM